MNKIINLYEINELFSLSNSDELKLMYLIDIVGMDAKKASDFVILWNSIKNRGKSDTEKTKSKAKILFLH